MHSSDIEILPVVFSNEIRFTWGIETSRWYIQSREQTDSTVAYAVGFIVFVWLL